MQELNCVFLWFKFNKDILFGFDPLLSIPKYFLEPGWKGKVVNDGGLEDMSPVHSLDLLT